jgi:hypothetical protein
VDKFTCFSFSAIIRYYTWAFDLSALFPTLANVYIFMYFVCQSFTYKYNALALVLVVRFK